MTDEASATQIRIRIPESLKQQIEDSAAKLGRSANREYQNRLESSFKIDELRSIIRQRDAEIDALNADLSAKEDALSTLEAQRRQDAGRQSTEMAVIKRAWDDTQEALARLTDTVDNRLGNEGEIWTVLQYLATDRSYIEAELSGRTRVLIAPPPPAVNSQLANSLRFTIDERTVSIVRLALKIAGVADVSALTKIHTEHSINRTEGFQG